MTQTLEQIKKLRLLSSAGIVDCREALKNSKGDFIKAQEWLKKKGLKIVANKKDRSTQAGVIETYLHCNGQVGAMVKLSCETDFVSATAEFKNLAHELAMQVAGMNPKNVKELLEQEYIRDPSKKIKNLINEVVAKVAENIKIEAFSYLSFKND